MTASVPVYAPCEGGLILNSNKFDLLDKPGVATILRNFEVGTSGGYRRINGFTAFGGVSATRPDGGNPILGIIPYALGVVVVVNDGVYYSEDGITWLQVNKDTGHAGVTEANLAAQATLTRSSQEKAHMVIARGVTGHDDNPYGMLYIATGADTLVHFAITGTGVSRTFSFYEIPAPITAAQHLEDYDHHLCVVDTVNEPNVIYYSTLNDYDDFTGTGSGSIKLPEIITGLKVFRDTLFVFCKNSIHRLVNINDPASLEVLPVTVNMGCIDGQTIQEIGGDLVFLSQDGLRTIAGTQRLDDIELGSVSRQIQPLLTDMIDSITDYTISSSVIRSKNQYRLFYTNSAGVGKGIIGTLRLDPQTGAVGFQWSETSGIDAYSIGNSIDTSGNESIYHGDINGYVFIHNDGDSFNGENIEAVFKSPDAHYGDLGLRKTLHYFNVSISNEGATAINVKPVFDFASSNVTQPASISLVQLTEPGAYGSTVYGVAVYGAEDTPLTRTALQGSGHSIAMKFNSEDTNPPYTIHGYHIELMPSGRK